MPHSLLERLREPGQQAAWARFVELYAPLVYRWGRRAGLQDSDAADLSRDVLLAVANAMPTFTYNPHQSFRAWLRTVTLNKWRDRSKRRATQPLPGSPEGLDEVAAPDGLEDFWEAEYRSRLAEHALNLMRSDFEPMTWQACLDMVIHGRSAPDVANSVGLSVGAVYAAKYRVLTRLRQELAGLLE